MCDRRVGPHHPLHVRFCRPTVIAAAVTPTHVAGIADQRIPANSRRGVTLLWLEMHQSRSIHCNQLQHFPNIALGMKADCDATNMHVAIPPAGRLLFDEDGR